MQLALTTNLFDRLLTSLGDFATSFANARYAAMDIERYHRMTDAELALRGITREDIADHVYRKYLR